MKLIKSFLFFLLLLISFNTYLTYAFAEKEECNQVNKLLIKDTEEIFNYQESRNDIGVFYDFAWDGDNEIVEIINNENRLIIFFNNGLILENDYLSGEILIEQNIKIKNINAVNFYENYILVNQMNGKIFLFRQ